MIGSMTELYYEFPAAYSLRQKIDHLRRHSKALVECSSKLSSADLAIAAKLYTSFAASLELIESTIPYKEGDRVRIIKAPKCEGGWSRAKHFLVVGAIGTVKSVEIDYLMRDWHLDLEFETESWIPHADAVGVPVLVLPSERHVWGFRPESVEKVEEDLLPCQVTAC